MASTNQSPFYQRAEKEFHEATSDEERIACLEIMIRECPKHKSSENMLKNLTNRLKKLRDSAEKKKKTGKASRQGIKKADMQCVIVGPPNTGKSSLFSLLTDQKAGISQHAFSTTKIQLGTMKVEDVKVQVIDTPPIPRHDKGLVNGADTLLIVIDSLSQLPQIEEALYRARGTRMIVVTKADKCSSSSIRKIKATLQSKYKKLLWTCISSSNISGLETETLKKKIFKTFPIIRIYTKEPKKEPTKEPLIMKERSSLQDAAEKILKGMAKKITKARVWGPSAKFPGQSFGLSHILKDKDNVEFQTQ